MDSNPNVDLTKFIGDSRNTSIVADSYIYLSDRAISIYINILSCTHKNFIDYFLLIRAGQ